MSVQVMLKDVRLSFPTLWEPEQYQGKGAYRYGASFLMDPGSTNAKAVEAAIEQAALEEFEKQAKATAFLATVRGNSNKFCFMSGDTKDYDGYKGKLVLTGHRRKEAGAPLVLGNDKDPRTSKLRVLVEGDGKPYAGCYVNAKVEIYIQTGQNPGVRCGLLTVQFVRDGDSFSGASAATDEDFEPIENGADAEDLA